ncbi:MAG: precorrin-2 C(20)-methyltransferase [Ahrensia sp.]|nr:precorrin-2 C(20)-methyltransferase [Ahrensia sp.]
MRGKLYGVGVGPGAPDLITLRALRLIEAAPVIAYPAPDDGISFARSIVSEFLRSDQIEIPIIVPMRVARFPAAEVYDVAAKEIADHLDNDRDVVVLCEGDPFFYGSFMYLYERLSDAYECEIVPGVSSIMTAAAMSGIPLAARNDVLTIIPGPLPDHEMRVKIDAADALVIMKVGRHLARIKALLADMNLLHKSIYLERVSLPEQRIMRLCDMHNDTAPYFSMITIYNGAEPWIDVAKMNVK